MRLARQSFWESLEDQGGALAVDLPQQDCSWSYRSLASAVEARADALSGRGRGLVFLFAENDIGGLVHYLASLQAGHAIYLLASKMRHPSVADLIERYRPELILSRLPGAQQAIAANYDCIPGEYGYHVYQRKVREDLAPHPDLALLLSTSASTGNPKSVRISRATLATAARQVLAALNVTARDHVVLNIPLPHVYGLSVVNSHLAAGARLTLDKRSVADAGFWKDRSRWGWSSLPGVTITYELMKQAGISSQDLKGIRKLTHTGSRCPADLIEWLHAQTARQGTEIYLMYGQTEACGRISVLPPDMLPKWSASVGRAVPGGCIAISPEQEIIYSGPNVMMGYASQRAHLANGPSTADLLRTGDKGYIGEEGLLFVSGRADRICKQYGERICLDDIEDFLRDTGPVAAQSRGESIWLFCEVDEGQIRRRLIELALLYRIPPQSFVLRRVERLPRTASGKVSYGDLRELQ